MLSWLSELFSPEAFTHAAPSVWNMLALAFVMTGPSLPLGLSLNDTSPESMPVTTLQDPGSQSVIPGPAAAVGNLLECRAIPDHLIRNPGMVPEYVF